VAELWHALRLDGSMLPHLTEQDLRDDLGMQSGIHRKAVLRKIKERSSVVVVGGGGAAGR
jgi:hypothetical protein